MGPMGGRAIEWVYLWRAKPRRQSENPPLTQTSGDERSLFLPLDEAIAYTAVFVIVSGSDGRAAETLLKPAK